MDHKFRIASALALVACLSVPAPATASAAGPLLSGYGGPGAGEQAIVGSTLLGGPDGGAGSGGSSVSKGSDGAGFGGSGAALSGGGGSASAGGHTGPSGASSSPGGGAGSAAASRAATAGTSAFVYPSSLRSTSAGSSAFGISGAGLLLLAGIVVALALVGMFTIRLARLQP